MLSAKVKAAMKQQLISGSSNPRIKDAIEVRRRGRKELILIEGPHLLEMAVNSGADIREVFLTDDFSLKKENKKLLNAFLKMELQLFVVAEHVMAKLADTKTPQGVVAIISPKLLTLDEIKFSGLPFFVVVDGLQDPGNLGTVIRTADAVGICAVIVLPGTCDIFMQKTIRASAGSIFNIPIIQTDTADFLEWAALNRIAISATSPDAQLSVFEAELAKPIAFVFGSEAHGVSERIRKASDMSIKIPLFGKAESLNVATSAAICLYETVRQRITAGHRNN